MPAIFPTALQTAVDARGRPYFLWDSDLSVDRLREQLRAPEPRVRAYFIVNVKVMSGSRLSDLQIRVLASARRDCAPAMQSMWQSAARRELVASYPRTDTSTSSAG